MSGMSMADPGGGYGPGLLRSILRYKIAIASTVVVAGLIGYFVSTLLTPVYEAKATIVLSDTDAFSDAQVDPTRKVQQEANRLTSRAVMSDAADALGGGMTAGDLRDRLMVQADATVGLIEIVASAGDADAAAEIANTVTAAYEEAGRDAVNGKVERANKVLQTQGADLGGQIDELEIQVDQNPDDAAAAQRLDSLRAQLSALETKLSDMAADAALFGAGIDEIENAIAPLGPSGPQPKRNAAIAGVVALAIASALAYWRAGVVDSRKLNPTAVLGAPLLAQIPRFKPTSDGGAGDPLFDFDAAEAYQFLLASFEYAVAQTQARSILVTSASPGDGKSLTSLHLARALAIQGREVMLVDADIRARGLTTLLGAQHQPGLVGLASGASLKDSTRRYRISESIYLPVVPAGQPPHKPTGLLATDRYRDAMSRIIDSSDLTIIDSGPLLTVADASAVAAQVSGVLLVIDANVSESDLVKVRDRMHLISTPLLGYVVNRAKDVRRAHYPYRPTPEVGRFRRVLGMTRSPHTSDPTADRNGGRSGVAHRVPQG